MASNGKGDSMETSAKLFYPNPDIQNGAHVRSMEQYREMHKQSIEQPDVFWGEIAEQFHFEKPQTEGKFLEYNFNVKNGPVFIKWMQGATTNVCYNVLDRHVKDGKGNKIAFYW